jgi:hypothetical protein
VAAFLAGAAVNPVVTVRAWHGFQHSFATARVDVIFANLLEPLNAAEYLPGLVTLAVPAALRLGWAGGTLLSLLLLFAAATGWWRARDRWGALCTLAGSLALMAYTLSTGFKYGWQKTAQFGAVFLVALTTAPLIEALREDWNRPGWRRRLAAASLAALLGFQAFATVTNLQQIREWSRQKLLSRDWLTLRTFAAARLPDGVVLVEAASFRMPFFHSMWAAYFLSPSQSYFARRGGEGGGYLRLGVQDESHLPGGRPDALLVSRRWADGVDFNSPRLLTGREHVLVSAANRVTDLQGFFPVNGIPDHVAARFAIEITPHSPSRLRLTLAPYKPAHWPRATWRLSRRTGATRETLAELDGPPPWQLEVPLLAGTTQTVEGEIVSAWNTSLEWPFALRQLIIESNP